MSKTQSSRFNVGTLFNRSRLEDVKVPETNDVFCFWFNILFILSWSFCFMLSIYKNCLLLVRQSVSLKESLDCHYFYWSYFYRRQWRINTGLSLEMQNKVKLPERQLKVSILSALISTTTQFTYINNHTVYSYQQPHCLLISTTRQFTYINNHTVYLYQQPHSLLISTTTLFTYINNHTVYLYQQPHSLK